MHLFFFFFNDTATTEIYTLSLHDALPIFPRRAAGRARTGPAAVLELRSLRRRAHTTRRVSPFRRRRDDRSEEHTSELQSPCNLVCRLLLEKKKTQSVILNSQRRSRGVLTL